MYRDALLMLIGVFIGGMAVAIICLSMIDKDKLKNLSMQQILKCAKDQEDLAKSLQARERQLTIREKAMDIRESELRAKKNVIQIMETKLSRSSNSQDWRINPDRFPKA